MTRIRSARTSEILGFIACVANGFRAYDGNGRLLGYFCDEDRAADYILNLK